MLFEITLSTFENINYIPQQITYIDKYIINKYLYS